jgi:hypothetical protein
MKLYTRILASYITHSMPVQILRKEATVLVPSGYVFIPSLSPSVRSALHTSSHITLVLFQVPLSSPSSLVFSLSSFMYDVAQLLSPAVGSPCHLLLWPFVSPSHWLLSSVVDVHHACIPIIIVIFVLPFSSFVVPCFFFTFVIC